MKIAMENEGCYRVGVIVSCTTTHGQTVEGEVAAYDQSSQLLIIKCASSSGRAGHHDVRILNLDFVTKVAIIRDAVDGPQKPLTNLNFTKLAKRLQTNLDAKMRQVDYVQVGVSPLAQRLVHAITKTINDVRWDGNKIVVMDKVIISSPYDVDSCQGPEDSPALNHVKKLVMKFHRESAGAVGETSPITS